VPAVDGSTDFSVLQNELKGSSKNIVLVAFDLLYMTAATSGSCRSPSARPN
jgi:ATP-dependent DNA ligase